MFCENGACPVAKYRKVAVPPEDIRKDSREQAVQLRAKVKEENMIC